MKWLKGLLIFALLLEWIRPLPLFTSVEVLPIFIGLLGWFSFLAVLELRGFLRFLLSLSGGVGAVYYLFYHQLQDDQSWKDFIRLHWSYNLQQILEGSYELTTAFARTVGFILVLWIVVSVVYPAVFVRNQGVWLLFTTISYLVLLDVGTIYEVQGPLLRTILYGLFLLALLQIRQVERTGVQMLHEKHQRTYLLGASLAVILFITSIAYAVPAPKETQPFAFNAWGTEGGSIQKVGYQSGDSKLGGPFMDDDSIVFTAYTPEKHYWRGESRAIYTGSEWKEGGGAVEGIDPQDQLPLGPLSYNMKLQKDLRIQVEFAEPKYNLLFYGGQVKTIKRVEPAQDDLYTKGNHDIQVGYLSSEDHVKNYELMIDLLHIEEKLLKESSTDYPQEIQQYLQIPLTLPERIQELAYELTKEKQDPYSKVLAIQGYLKRDSRLMYEKVEVPYLQDGEDFVDQFIFETKRGYCDHFSTSMVVMLRTIGIPARYVKGFSTGDLKKGTDQGYEVTMRNKNAHSWPEVYFAGYGWIPFEPTPGFIQPIKVESHLTTQDEEAVPASARVPLPTMSSLDELERVEEDMITENNRQDFSWAWIFLFIMVIMILGAMAYKKKDYIRFWILDKRSQRIEHEDGFAKIYLALLSVLGKTLSTRKTGESLQEYAERISLPKESKEELNKITSWYESYLYGPSSESSKDWRNVKNILQQFIRHFLS